MGLLKPILIMENRFQFSKNLCISAPLKTGCCNIFLKLLVKYLYQILF